MSDLKQKINEAVSFIQSKTDISPRVGLITGTGLGVLLDDMEVSTEIDYADIPHFPVSTVQSHKGKLVLGTLAGKQVIAMAGRFHYYEGYSMQQLTFPIRVLKYLGIDLLFITNASGSTHQDYKTGDIMILNDHINLFPDHPLRGANDESIGPRFPDMLKTYNKDLIQKAMNIAEANGISCKQGVYAGLTGPSLETPAEYQYMHNIGAHAVGMSTVPEILVAKHMELPIFAASVITDAGYPSHLIQETSVEDVIEVANTTGPKLAFIFKEMIKDL